MSTQGGENRTSNVQSGSEDWREIAQKAADEKDPHKLLALVHELCTKLEQRDAVQRRRPAP